MKPSGLPLLHAKILFQSPLASRRATLSSAGAALLLALAGGCGGGSPAQVMLKGVESAVRAGDARALLAHADLKGALSMQHYLLLNSMAKCAANKEGTTASLQTLDEAARAKVLASLAGQQAEFPVEPEGFLVISAKGESNRDLLRIPYGTVQGKALLLGGRMLPAKRAELVALDAMKATEISLVDGMPDKDFKKDKTWRERADALPVGGGEPGAAWTAQLAKLAAAVAANDPDAAAAATGAWGQNVLGATDYEGKPVPMNLRKLQLLAQAPRFLKVGSIMGGWIKDDRAVLAIEGENHAGNIERGAVYMQKGDKGWEEFATDLVEIPKG